MSLFPNLSFRGAFRLGISLQVYLAERKRKLFLGERRLGMTEKILIFRNLAENAIPNRLSRLCDLRHTFPCTPSQEARFPSSKVTSVMERKRPRIRRFGSFSLTGILNWLFGARCGQQTPPSRSNAIPKIVHAFFG